jgi:hypothetical protein
LFASFHYYATREVVGTSNCEGFMREGGDAGNLLRGMRWYGRAGAKGREEFRQAEQWAALGSN